MFSDFSCRDCSPVIVLYTTVHVCTFLMRIATVSFFFTKSNEVMLCELAAQKGSIAGEEKSYQAVSLNKIDSMWKVSRFLGYQCTNTLCMRSAQ